MKPLDQLTAGDFRPCLEQEFELRLPPGETLPLTLIEVGDLGRLPQGAPVAGRRPFSLLFRAPGPGYLPQAIYLLVHPRMGELEIFLVPLGPDGRGMCYQAVFS